MQLSNAKMFAAGLQVVRIFPGVPHILSIPTNLEPKPPPPKFLQTSQSLPVIVDPFSRGPNIKSESSSRDMGGHSRQSCGLSLCCCCLDVPLPPLQHIHCLHVCIYKSAAVCLHVCAGVNGLCSPLLPPSWVFPSS